jgi:hypothetical protein
MPAQAGVQGGRLNARRPWLRVMSQSWNFVRVALGAKLFA